MLCVGGVLVLAWVFQSSIYRTSEGFLAGTVCLPTSVGIALFILGCAATGPLRRAAFGFALAMVGQAVTLQMIGAGSGYRYQRYKPFEVLAWKSAFLTSIHPALLIFLVAQATLVLLGLRGCWRQMQAWISRTLSKWGMLAVVLIFALSSARLAQQIELYVAELLFATLLQALNVFNVVLMVWAVPGELLGSWKRRIDRFFNRSATPQDSDVMEPVVAWGAMWVIMLAAALSWFVYERHPHIADEVVYLVQARYFAAGMLTMPIPPVPAAFDLDLMNYEADRWFSPVPPGWPLILALGVLGRAPWLVNPVLAGLNVVLTYVLMRQIYDRRMANLTVLLLAVSPWHVLLAMSFMPHTASLTCALAAAVSVGCARKNGRPLWGLAAGGATGMLSLIRPLEGLVVAALLGLWVIGIGGRRLKASGVAAFLFGCVAVGATVLPYNKLLSGQATVFPITAYIDKYYWPKANALGFGPERGLRWTSDPYPGHSPRDALVNTNFNIYAVNVELLGWSTGSLFFLALLVAGGPTKRDYLMVAVIAVIVGAHFFYWFSGGPDFAARYWFLVLVACLALTARGILHLEAAISGGSSTSTAEAARVTIGVLALAVLAVLNYLPWRALDKHFHYRNMRPVRSLAQRYGFGNSLMLVRGHRYPDYMSAAAENPPDLRADAPVYAWDRSPEVRSAVLAAYPARQVWIVNGPSITGAGFEVVDGPRLASDLLKEAQGE